MDALPKPLEKGGKGRRGVGAHDLKFIVGK